VTFHIYESMQMCYQIVEVTFLFTSYGNGGLSCSIASSEEPERKATHIEYN